MLTKAGIDTSVYSPKTNPTHNIMYGVLYFLKTAEQLKNKYPDIQDVDYFVYASYNAGINKIMVLLKESRATSRGDFVEYVADNLM
ncbi:transglycosylase SLT domain-containing protein [Patescibacteria group bacterium]|nr:transglycosylase SLT domain-containing protein [Patescibacteria group bacterium]